jgi:hypothetical protein
MGESLRDILQALTRYSANDRELPVNDRCCSPGLGYRVDGGGNCVAVTSTP